MTTSTRRINVTINSAQARAGAAQVNAALGSIGKGAGQTGNELQSANKKLDGFSNGAKNAGKNITAANSNIVKTTGSIGGMAKSIIGATLAFAGLTAVIGGLALMVPLFTGAGDAAAQMQARLMNVTKSTAEFGAAQEAVRRIANETRSGFVATTDLYSKFAKVSNNAEAATRTFAMALKVSGAAGAQADSAILQLGQALGSGKLSGDEFASINENAQAFMDILAESMGVARGALKDLAAQGKITSAEIEKALTDPEVIRKLEEQFGKIPVTFGDVKVGISNAMIDIASALKEGFGIDATMAQMLGHIQQFGANSKPFFTDLAKQIKETFAVVGPIIKAALGVITPVLGFIVNNLGTIAKVAISVGAAFLVMKASMGLSAVIADVIKLGVSMGATGGISGIFTGAMNMATGAVNRLTLALLANPFTAIAVLLTGTIALLWQFRDSIKVGAGEFGTLGDMGRAAIEMIGPAFKKLADNVKFALDEINKWMTKTFGGIWKPVSEFFKKMDVSLFGLMKMHAQVLDFIEGGFFGAFSAIKNLWGALPQLMGSIVSATANKVISGIEDMVAKAIDGMNKLIDMANKIPLVNIERMGAVTFGRAPVIEAPDMWAIRNQSFADERRTGRADAVDALRNRTAQIGAARNARENEASTAIADPAATPPPGSPAAAVKGASDAAKQAAEAVRDFWEGLEKARDAAGLVGFELDLHNTILERRNLLGRDAEGNLRQIGEHDKARIESLLRETALRNTIADITASNVEASRALGLEQQRGQLLGTMTVEQVETEMAVRTRMADRQAQALIDGVDLQDAAFNLRLAEEESLIRQIAAQKALNSAKEAGLSRGAALIARYNRDADPRGEAARLRGARDADINLKALNKPSDQTQAEWEASVSTALEGSAREFAEDLQDISNRHRDQMLDAVDQIADGFGGQMGEIIRGLGRAWESLSMASQGDYSQSGILGGIADLFGGPKGKENAFGKGVKQGADAFSPGAMTEAFKNPMKSMQSSFDGFSGMFKNGGGGLVAGLGKAMGGAMQGSAIGSAVGGVGKMLWKQFNETGSQIGGMVGSIFGPIGSILGSIGGGIIGGLISGRKVSSGKAGITLDEMTGTLQVSTSGKHGGEADAAAMGDKVVSGITTIAQRLGVFLGGNPNVAVGKNGGDFRVSPTGGGVTGKEGINFKTEAEAIAFAIKDLISDGILVGLSAFSERVLKNAKNLDSVLALAENYEKIIRELANFNDPMGAALKDVTTNLDRLLKMMKLAGATSEEMANIEQYRKIKLDEILKSSLSKLTDFRKDLFGEGSGVTALNRLNAAQGEFAKMQADILSGKSIDQEDFTRVGQEIFGLARDVFGTSSSQFQSIRDALIAATDGAIDNVNEQFNDATVVAIQQQTDAANQNAAITNDLLRQLVAQGGGMTGANDAGYGVGSMNGRYMNQRV